MVQQYKEGEDPVNWKLTENMPVYQQVIAGIATFISAGLIMLPLVSMIQQELGLPSMIFSYIGGIVLMLLSVTIGCVVAKKHKILASIGIYYGINMVMSIITGIISFVGAMGDFWISDSTQSASLYFSMGIPGVLYLIIGVVGYFLMHRLVDKKLNLP